MVIQSTQNLTYGFSNLLDSPRSHVANPQLPAREVFALGMFLSLLQIIDGMLTNMGVTQFGVQIEGNPFLRSMMLEFGHVPTLTAVKVMSIMLVITLTVYSGRIPWVKHALKAITGIYIAAAIVPWTYILFIVPLI